MQHILDVMKKMNGVDDDGYETMTVDEVAEMVRLEFMELRDCLYTKYPQAAKERARAIAEALVGVKVTR